MEPKVLSATGSDHTGQVKSDFVFSQLFILAIFLALSLSLCSLCVLQGREFVSKFLKQAHSAWGIWTRLEHLFATLPQFPCCSSAVFGIWFNSHGYRFILEILLWEFSSEP